MAATAAEAVDAIFALFEAHGSGEYIGEAVSQVEHATQAAYHATACKSEDVVVAAALLHDLGHLIGLAAPAAHKQMGDCGIMEHERHGADMLRRLGFPERMAKLVQLHVGAKRYRCWKDPSYLNKLSPASVTTLGYQGGPMSDAEGAAFEADADSPIILLMRTWDEAAKVPGAAVPSLQSYRPMLEALWTSVHA